MRSLHVVQLEARPFALALAALLAACSDLKQITAKMPWDHPSIAEVAPKAPMLPLALPKEALRGEKGPANATYPAGFAVTIKPDGTVVFPEGAPGKIKGASIVVGGSAVATLAENGEVSGSGLKRRYRFAADGDLLDAQGRGLRLSPEGGIRGIGGPWHYKDVMQWSDASAPERPAEKKMGKNDGPEWDRAAWRTVAIVSVLMLENLLPEALGR
jgi:hypothetical protein